MGKFKLHSYCYKEMDYEIKESTSYTIYVTSKKCILDGLSKKTMCLGEVVIPLKDGKRGLFINGAYRVNDDSFFVIDDVRHVIEEALSDNQLAKRYKLFSFNVSDRKNENRNERTQNIKLAEYGSKISKRYHIIRNRDCNCPYCNTKLTELTTYCRFRCYKCTNCNAILMRSDMYYLLDPVDRVVFDNENELPEISFDNSRYAIQLEKERIVLYREQRERAKERRKQKEETRELKQALKIAEERGGEPLGKLPKQRKRGFFS